ncbi:MAG: hypothetical protein HFJ54_05860 [Clostridia bacterium]|nr:hypothetical protein [Clostridia bacterium]
MVVEVIISSNAKDLNRIFDYNVPEEKKTKVHIGSKVLVPFGTMRRAQEGFVIGIKEKSEYKIKDILNIEEGLQESKVVLAKLMANKYFCNISECIKLMLPPGTTAQNIENRVKEKVAKFVYLKKTGEEISEEIERKVLKSDKQIRTLNFLIQNDEVLLSELIIFAETSNSVVKTLEKNGYVEIIEKEINRNPFRNKNIVPTKDLELTKQQQKAFNKIEASINDKQFNEYLIHGVTGSRKNRNISATYSEKY